MTCLVNSIVHQPVDPGGERKGEGTRRNGRGEEGMGWGKKKRSEDSTRQDGRDGTREDETGGDGRKMRGEKREWEGPSMYL